MDEHYIGLNLKFIIAFFYSKLSLILQTQSHV